MQLLGSILSCTSPTCSGLTRTVTAFFCGSMTKVDLSVFFYLNSE